jgi:hypothetical protein
MATPKKGATKTAMAPRPMMMPKMGNMSSAKGGKKGGKGGKGGGKKC